MADRIEVSVADLAAALEDFEVGIVRDDGTVAHPGVVAERLWQVLAGMRANAAHREPRAATCGDPEIEAIAAIVEALARLESETDGNPVPRVVRWLCERYLRIIA